MEGHVRGGECLTPVRLMLKVDLQQVDVGIEC